MIALVYALSSIFMLGVGFLVIKIEIQTKNNRNEYNQLLSGRKAQKEA